MAVVRAFSSPETETLGIEAEAVATSAKTSALAVNAPPGIDALATIGSTLTFLSGITSSGITIEALADIAVAEYPAFRLTTGITMVALAVMAADVTDTAVPATTPGITREPEDVIGLTE